jgi:membrane protein DedA with SNARE-associated domain
MIENFVNHMNVLSPFWIYCILIFFSFFENIFPPSPSDLIVIIGAAIISGGGGSVSLFFVLVITSLASSFGFILMYYIGLLLGEKVIRTRRISFISQSSIENTDKWFARYGYKLILFNRFIPGMRSVISFFSGVSELELKRTFVLATLSAFLWNVIIIYLGYVLGNNLKLIDRYLSAYSTIVVIISIVVIAAYLIYNFIYKKKGRD